MNDKLKHDSKGFLLGNPLNDPEIEKKLGRIDDNTSAALGYLQKIANVKVATPRQRAAAEVVNRLAPRAQVVALKRSDLSNAKVVKSIEKAVNRLVSPAQPTAQARRGYGKMFEASMPRTAMQKRMDKVRSYRKGSAFKAADSRMAQAAPSLDIGGGVWSGLKTAGGYALGAGGLWAASKWAGLRGGQQATLAESAASKVKAPTMMGRAANYVKSSAPVQGAIGVASTAGKWLRRLPWLGALLGTGEAVASELSDDDRATKDKNTGRALGGVGGALAGGLAGAKAGAMLGAFSGPIGMAIGGAVGAAAGAWFGDDAGKYLGEKLGEIVTLFREGKLFDVIAAPFREISDLASKFWTDTKTDAQRARDGLPSLAQEEANKRSAAAQAAANANPAPYSNEGRGKVDPSITANEAARLPEDLSKPAFNTAKPFRGTKSMIGMATPDVPVSFGTMFGTAARGISNATDWTLGSLSAKYEGKVGSANKDNIGHAYGKYQFNSATGGLNTFLADNPEYAKQFEGLKPNTKAFADKWREIAKNDPQGFESAQDKSASNIWYKPAELTARGLGFKMDDRGVQEAVFSGSIQHGGISNILKSTSGVDGFSDMSSADQIKTFYAKRADYVNGLSKLSETEKAAQAGRYAKELPDAISLSGRTQSVTATPLVTSSSYGAGSGIANAIAPPPMQLPPMPKTESQQMTQLSTQKQEPITVRIDSGAAGQEVRDRSIAHIASGGMKL